MFVFTRKIKIGRGDANNIIICDESPVYFRVWKLPYYFQLNHMSL